MPPPSENPQRGLGREGLETLFPRLAQLIDATPLALRERFLVKAFLLLAEESGDLDGTLRCLEQAANQPTAGRGTVS